jgi:hypothetical protein
MQNKPWYKSERDVLVLLVSLQMRKHCPVTAKVIARLNAKGV